MQDFAAAGADMFTFHLEAVTEERGPQPGARVLELIKTIKGQKMYAGMAISPATAIEAVFPYVEQGALDMVSCQEQILKPQGHQLSHFVTCCQKVVKPMQHSEGSSKH